MADGASFSCFVSSLKAFFDFQTINMLPVALILAYDLMLTHFDLHASKCETAELSRTETSYFPGNIFFPHYNGVTMVTKGNAQ